MDYGKVFSQLFISLTGWVIITGAYHIAKAATDYCRKHNAAFVDSWRGKVIAYSLCVSLALLVSYCSAQAIGTHIEGDDPVRGGGYAVFDYSVSDSKRMEHGLVLFLLIVFPVLFGTFKGYKLPLRKRRSD